MRYAGSFGSSFAVTREGALLKWGSAFDEAAVASAANVGGTQPAAVALQTVSAGDVGMVCLGKDGTVRYDSIFDTATRTPTPKVARCSAGQTLMEPRA